MVLLVNITYNNYVWYNIIRIRAKQNVVIIDSAKPDNVDLWGGTAAPLIGIGKAENVTVTLSVFCYSKSE